ncbi:hypothetical protein STPYR_12690 [uncultured Stenotrophomonas sp.]|uniref:Uncharacterized protein n=1 Tax=uncultured Stenotrophomonas sp. TaxID=165438 RepID=A0A1Y5QBC8_9GAMM|nr:hypothetical protein STPYR_12690 [uncultured Stenotrophomonas sp.]
MVIHRPRFAGVDSRLKQGVAVTDNPGWRIEDCRQPVPQGHVAVVARAYALGPVRLQDAP